jgi:hypothetical protein
MSKSDWTGILDSVRAKTGKTDLMTSGMVASEIEGIQAGGGAVSVSPKDVNFYDYDGTLLYSYTVEEAQALTELPELPTQKGLICQGWNWTLDEIKAQNGAVDVGAVYITDDGKTRIYIRIPIESRLTVPLHFSQSEDNGVTIDWGDGSAKETLAGTAVQTSHTYASIGDYVISLDVADTCILKTPVYPRSSSLLSTSIPYLNMLYRFECGKNIKFDSYGFHNCFSLKNITISNGAVDGLSPTYLFHSCYSLLFATIPKGVTNLNSYTFGKCYSLKVVSLPNTVTVMQANIFDNSYALARAIIPSGVTSLGGNLFTSCYSLLSGIIPKSVTNIPASCFSQCKVCGLYDFTRHTSVPTLANTNAFTAIPSDCQIRVPASLYDEWVAATNWSTYASNIVAV